nr:uncharacterized protein LOC126543503 [Dermacentor andersoni]
MGDGGPQRPPDKASPAVVALFVGSRDITDYRLPDSSDSSAAAEMESDSDYTLVQSRHLKRKLRRTSADSDSTHKTRCDERNPTTAGTNLNSLNRQSLTKCFDRIASGHVREIRINARKDILTLDVSSQAVLEALKAMQLVDNIPVRSFLAYGNDTCTGVVPDVDIDIKDKDLRPLLSSTVRILDIHRFGPSGCIKLVFESNSLPASIKVGYVRHSVRPYVPRPLQCHKCFKLGHVSLYCEAVNRTDLNE